MEIYSAWIGFLKGGFCFAEELLVSQKFKSKKRASTFTTFTHYFSLNYWNRASRCDCSIRVFQSLQLQIHFKGGFGQNYHNPSRPTTGATWCLVFRSTAQHLFNLFPLSYEMSFHLYVVTSKSCLSFVLICYYIHPCRMLRWWPWGIEYIFDEIKQLKRTS